MQYAMLGNAGLFVSRIALGAMTFAGAGAPALGDAVSAPPVAYPAGLQAEVAPGRLPQQPANS
ncbi:hypothetical protein AB0J14_03045 [Micromonospora arborensis]|uniref:hypothetical protein n=1 Tax=Micromonospora arborensis TaxID=2116518 RepID=UPI0033E504C3